MQKEEPVLDKFSEIEKLKTTWFTLALREKRGKTKYITKRLDNIEIKIKELQNETNSTNG